MMKNAVVLVSLLVLWFCHNPVYAGVAQEKLTWEASEGAEQYIVDYTDGGNEYVYKTANTSVSLNELRVPYDVKFTYTVTARAGACFSDPSEPYVYTRKMPETRLPETICVSVEKVEINIKVFGGGQADSTIAAESTGGL